MHRGNKIWRYGLPCSQNRQRIYGILGGIMKIEKIGELAPKTCETCVHYIPFDDKTGACIKRIKYTYVTNTCGYYSTEITDESKLEKVAEAYVEIHTKIQELQELKEILRKVLIQEVQTRAITENYLIIVSTVKQRRLNTKKVKEFLTSINKLEEFTTETEFQTIKIKPLKPKNL